MKLVLSLLAAISLAVLVGCGGGSSSSSSSTSTTVSISPSSVTLETNSTQQFTATVSNSTSGVAWSVNTVAGGNYSVGTITSTGLYTAPAVVPSPATVTVTAVSLADATQTASVKVTITQGTALSISVSPTSANVFTGQSQQFTATVTPNTNSGVTWEVNSTVGGSSTVGTINSTGLYTAPTTVPSPATVTITALSQADSTKSATASVTIVLGTVLVITPSTVTVPGGGQQQFTITANGQTATVTLALNCQSQAQGACGSITSAGLYTAPPTPPPGGTVTLTATATDNSALPASAIITIQFANGSLNGQYAFSFAGHSAGAPFVSAGSVTLDGNGNITGGEEDINDGTPRTVAITGGSYHVGSDGRGNATVQTASGSETWQFVVANYQHADAIRFEGGTITGSGTLDRQQPSSFALSSVTGGYALRLSGAPPSMAATAGAFSADGAGGIASGLLDITTAGTVSASQTLTGSYGAPDSSGRGTLTLTTSGGTQALAYYLIDATRAVIIATDAGKLLRGQISQQPAGPFSAANLSGPFAFVVSGSATLAPLGVGGTFTTDAAGNLTSGSSDRNVNGNWQTGLPLTGTYQVSDAATGRTTASLSINGSPVQFALYPAASGRWYAVQVDGAAVASGVVAAQAQTAFSASALSGSYAAAFAGTDFTTSPGEEDAVAVVNANGGSALTGAADFNDNGLLSRTASLQGSYIFNPGTGRAAATVQTNSGAFQSGIIIVYAIDGSTSLLLETDSNRLLVGTMRKQ
jgi:hypothetical protein